MLARLLAKRTDTNVLGIDCSTNSVAYALMNNGKLEDYGEIEFLGSDVYERLGYAYAMMHQASSTFERANYVAIEKTITVKSPATAVKMGYVAGVVMGSILFHTTAVVKEVAPISWQSAIGNKSLSVAEKAQIRKDNPGHKPSWYQNKGRLLRKQRTIDWAQKTFGIIITSDNVADAIGIAWFASQ